MGILRVLLLAGAVAAAPLAQAARCCCAWYAPGSAETCAARANAPACPHCPADASDADQECDGTCSIRDPHAPGGDAPQVPAIVSSPETVHPVAGPPAPLHAPAARAALPRAPPRSAPLLL